MKIVSNLKNGKSKKNNTISHGLFLVNENFQLGQYVLTQLQLAEITYIIKNYG